MTISGSSSDFLISSEGANFYSSAGWFSPPYEAATIVSSFIFIIKRYFIQIINIM